ncbi:YitT family protein [Clostridium thermobutyricum]|uniref:YitT family protein n=1 Tax=Clostridium thermobutyricum TaxID=29372 RepID=UPI0018A8DF85|nr:YitT family protein [Clostridium thermobutyricum]
MKEKFKEYLMITIGMLFVVIAIQFFFIPNNITAGGVTGISVVICEYIKGLNVGLVMGVLNIFLFIIAFIFIGRDFGGKTIYAAMGISFINWAIEEFFTPMAVTNDLMLSTIAGSLFLGIGLGIVFTQDASTGGTDIIAKILNKFFHIEMGRGMQIVDIIVVIFSGITFGIEKAIYAAICVILTGIVIDKVISGYYTCHQVIIFTNKTKYIKEYIINDIDRGCTIFTGEGGYTGENKNIIYCVLERAQLMKVRKFLKENEPEAFVIVNDAHDVLGKGFEKIE